MASKKPRPTLLGGRPWKEVITPRQEEMLDAIERYWDEHGIPPTIHELAETLHYRVSANVLRVVDALARKGLASRRLGTRRSIRSLRGVKSPRTRLVEGGVRVTLPPVPLSAADCRNLAAALITQADEVEQRQAKEQPEQAKQAEEKPC